MISTTTPPPTATSMSTDALSSVVAAVQGDPASVAAGIRQRVEQSRQGTHVQMMGGWTDNKA
ncbi:hypothetical protein [Streptomyces sp. MK37H]|uniref:hypothetical protein n=1 Tax=Streptomyces sp. MK37H TaxID=2699117 RepID=UPI001B361AA4|nr:hypothetical protein [Streptomyces sp. MK37H]MBP8533127.1 hypothetical protein [Streptomyces sp. MK37H]